MKFRFLKIVFCLLFFVSVASKAQINYGGKPLPYIILRSSSQNFFRTMPSFDIEAEKRLDSLSQNDFRGGVRFAYKFITDFTPSNSGTSFILADGTKVWRLGIRSVDAYSINVLFTEYELPEGARLFLYTPDQSQILGSFNHQNNSELGILPVAPVNGDELIIEYQEPPGVEFAGRLKVGEVNHGYRDFRGIEPANRPAMSSCMPSPVCYSDTTEKYNEVVRSVVLLIIDGVTLCSGVLINNTQNDGTPYLLTALHCLNKQFTVENPNYSAIAGTIVSFFNYESPFCGPVIRGSEELSMASARCRAVNEKTDMALLELLEKPPIYYRPYYAGWNIEERSLPPYTNIHQAGGSVKRINIAMKPISLFSYSSNGNTSINFNPDSFWRVEEWSVGSTAGGSSGSPLFDSNFKVVGALTGGQSTCAKPNDDLFYALHKSWKTGEVDTANLQPWLAPGRNSSLQCDGFDPYGDDRAVKLSNIPPDGSRESAEAAYLPDSVSGQQFGVNTLGINEYAEAYEATNSSILHGVYFVTPAASNQMNLKIEVNVYNSTIEGAPAEVLATTSFSPTYTNISIIDGSFQETIKSLSRSQESFIKFDAAVTVPKKFFVGYKITAPKGDLFTVFSLPRDVITKNTVWLKYNNKWIENTSHPENPYKTSLLISPVVQEISGGVSNATIPVLNLTVAVDRDLKRITVVNPEVNERLEYAVYAIDGRLVRKGYMTGNQHFFTMREKGLFIIRVFSGNNNYIAKFTL